MVCLSVSVSQLAKCHLQGKLKEPCINYYYYNNRFTALCILSRTTRVSRYQKKHSPTHTYHGHQSFLICFLHHLSSIYVPDSLFSQSLSKYSLVYLLAWHPPLHTPYTSSPNHCLLFSAHAHTIVTCFAVVPRLCHLIVVSLSTFTWNSIL